MTWWRREPPEPELPDDFVAAIAESKQLSASIRATTVRLESKLRELNDADK